MSRHDEIIVFESVAYPGKWTWHGCGAHGRDLCLFNTKDEARADAERWLASSEYERGYRDGYERRDMEVQGALA